MKYLKMQTYILENQVNNDLPNSCILYFDILWVDGYFWLSFFTVGFYSDDQKFQLTVENTDEKSGMSNRATLTKHVSAAWENVIPMKEVDNVSVYISHPVP